MGHGKIIVMRVLGFILAIGIVSLIAGGVIADAKDGSEVITPEQAMELRELPSALAKVEPPKIEDPQWLKDKKTQAVAPAKPDSATSSAKRTFRYSVESWGRVTVDLADFRAKVLATLNSPQGWSRANVSFAEAQSGGDFVLVISEAAELERRYSPGCSAEYSCRVGPYVIINQDRWLGATPSWNAAGGSLRDYQHMVINHEIGHWLGHGHQDCPAPGSPAPVMQQQSISLQGCKFNPWPLSSEVWIAR